MRVAVIIPALNEEASIAQVIAAPEKGQVGPVDRPEKTPAKHLVELVEIEIQVKQPVAELVTAWYKTAVPNLPFV